MSIFNQLIQKNVSSFAVVFIMICFAMASYADELSKTDKISNAPATLQQEQKNKATETVGFSKALLEHLFTESGCSDSSLNDLNRQLKNYDVNSVEYADNLKKQEELERKRQNLINKFNWTNEAVQGIIFHKFTLEQQKECFEKLHEVFKNFPDIRMNFFELHQNAENNSKQLRIIIDAQKVGNNLEAFYLREPNEMYIKDVASSIRNGAFLHEILHGVQVKVGPQIKTDGVIGALCMFASEAETKALNVISIRYLPALAQMEKYASKVLNEKYYEAYRLKQEKRLYNEADAAMYEQFLDEYKNVLPEDINERNVIFKNLLVRGYLMQVYMAAPENRQKYMDKIGIHLTKIDHKVIEIWHDFYQDYASRAGYIYPTEEFSQERVQELKNYFYRRYGVEIPVEEAIYDYRKVCEKAAKK